MNKVRELHGIFYEKDRGVIADHVIVTFFSVMFDGKTTGITVTIVCTSLTSDS